MGSVSSPYVVLISGTNRGLGKGLLERYLLRPNHTVIAANRDMVASQHLSDLPKAAGSELIIVKYDGANRSSAALAIKDLEARGIDHIDLVIANAGIALVFPLVREVSHDDLQQHLDVNAHGTLSLFQATLPLLKKSKDPKWVSVSSSAGSISATPPAPNAAYGPSKAVINWLTKRVHEEEEWLTSFVLHPGWVQTDNGLHSAKCFGLDDATTQQMLLKVGESHPGMIKLFDEATRETHGGKFFNYDGTVVPW